jgi:hypothetical protein
MTQLTTSDDQTTFVVTEVTTLAKINHQQQDSFCELPILQKKLYRDGLQKPGRLILFSTRIA